MPADSQLLSCVPLFERLDEEERALLAAQLDEESFPAGQIVFRKGEPGNSIYIVASGEIEIFVEDTTGGRIVFETAKTGDFFGELSLLDGDPRSASAKAISDSKALKVDREDLQLLFQRHPAAAMDILAVIGRRLREADKLLGSRQTSSPNEAIAERLGIIDRAADFVAAFSGTFTFLMLHVVWFVAWLGVNSGMVPHFPAFDPYPFQFLTMVVSLEAIGLSCLVLISQSRQAVKDRIRSEVEYEANIRAGLEVTQLHVKVDALYEQVLARLAALEKKVTAAGQVATPQLGPEELSEMSALWVEVQKTVLTAVGDPHAAFHMSRRALGLLRAKVALRGCELGARVAVMGPLEIDNRGRIQIEHHAYFLPGMLATRIKVAPGAELLIGPHGGFNFGVTIEVSEQIRFGHTAMVASMVTFRDAPGKPISIGHNVWIAHGAAIEPGVTIGEGSVISAGTVVTRDVPANHLAIGSPARNVRLDTLSRPR